MTAAERPAWCRKSDGTLADLVGESDSLTHLDDAWDAAWDAVDADLLAVAAGRTAMLLGHLATIEAMTADERADLSNWHSAERFGPAERAVLDLTEQYLLDVTSITDAQIAVVAEHVGPDAVADFVNALLVVEQRMRLELGLAAVLVGRSDLVEADNLPRASCPPVGDERRVPFRTQRESRLSGRPSRHAPLHEALGAFAAAAVRNDRIDPVTTELVRLRCARHHDCHT